ncbi:YeeE/YedE family protein [Altererythrobacter indicus]|uniref:YeeE/YedE family protein n=1 Tax=Altericroceibacterium indicum TaxID=374177 RepID=A0A845A7R6_9SPHN|nr:YeeE/YedE thiosulfate transporter family protein [Altericroceibacterium indicum]MXP26402.1 YeeE/YedE family protein [Altericroceibacterium indicum]
MIPGFPYAQPIEGFLGGLLIGLAAAIMLLGIGRIAGISGLLARASGMSDSGPKQSIALMFIIGLVIGGGLFSLTLGPIEVRYPPNLWWLVPAGLVVGIGTRLGSGCTSGHGVCGMSRLSRRSIIATLTFMVAGFATVALVNLSGGGW